MATTQFKVGDKVRLSGSHSVKTLHAETGIKVEALTRYALERTVGVVEFEDGSGSMNLGVQFPGGDIDNFWWFNEDWELEPAEPLVVADSVSRVGYSVSSFYERFGLEPSLEDTENVLNEEVAEFKAAVDDQAWSRERLRWAHQTQDEYEIEAIGEEIKHDEVAVAYEFADAFYTLVGHALAAGSTEQALLDAIEHKIQQNDNKTLKSHEVITLANGARKIQRKGRRSPHVEPRVIPNREYDATSWDE